VREDVALLGDASWNVPFKQLYHLQEEDKVTCIHEITQSYQSE